MHIWLPPLANRNQLTPLPKRCPQEELDLFLQGIPTLQDVLKHAFGEGGPAFVQTGVLTQAFDKRFVRLRDESMNVTLRIQKSSVP